ncbi:permease [Shouchella shacheensis]|uniref:permease n=1 Tax=Shouchella shacheensis TaxID=1649580 RepID=UPI0007404F55|nr:permease [Shouchella shacheensis]
MRTFIYDLIGFGFITLLFALFIAFPALKYAEWTSYVPEEITAFLTIFISILLEALPFLLVGALFSAVIGLYVKAEHIAKWIPKHPVLSLLPALLLACLLPICECAIVPVIRHFIRKGVPIHVAVAFMTAAPILNPIVAASTYFAFRMDATMVGWRMGMALLCTCVIALMMYFLFRNQRGSDVLKGEPREEKDHHHRKGLMSIVNHTADDFLFMVRFFIIGAFLASLFQVFLARDWLAYTGDSTTLGIGMMMGLGYFLSLCSEADAFIAASFGRAFSFEATLAFLLLGPMLDLKNTLMMAGMFKWRFIIWFHLIVSGVVYLAMWILGTWGGA